MGRALTNEVFVTPAGVHAGGVTNGVRRGPVSVGARPGDSKIDNQPAMPARSPSRAMFLPERLREFVKFCLVGGSGVFVDMGVLFLLADPRMLALNLTLSKICAAETALVNNFIWNEVWTFKAPVAGERKAGAVLRRLLFFNAICGVGISLAVLLLHFFHTLLGWNLYLSNLLAIGLVTLWNFGLNARFNWGYPTCAGARRSTRPTDVRAIGLCIIVGLLCEISPSSADQLHHSRSQIEDLKAYLQHRPPVELAIIRQSNWVVNQPSFRGGAAPLPTTYAASAQGEDFYIRHFSFYTADFQVGFGGGNPFSAGRSGPTIWDASSTYILTADLDARGASQFRALAVKASTNILLKTVSIQAALLNRFLDLGLVDVDGSSYKWSGNSFTVGLNRGATAEGELVVEGGKVTAIKYHILGHQKTLKSELSGYSVNPLLPPFLPARVVQRAYDQNGRQEPGSMDYEFLNFKISEGALPPSWFLPERFVHIARNIRDAATNRMVSARLVLTNGAVYQVQGQTLVPVAAVAPHKPSLSASVFFMLGLVIMACLPLILLHRSRRLRGREISLVSPRVQTQVNKCNIPDPNNGYL